MKIEVTRRQHFGIYRYYPHNTTAQQFTELLGSTTLTLYQLRMIHNIGIPIDIKLYNNMSVPFSEYKED